MVEHENGGSYGEQSRHIAPQPKSKNNIWLNCYREVGGVILMPMQRRTLLGNFRVYSKTLQLLFYFDSPYES